MRTLAAVAVAAVAAVSGGGGATSEICIFTEKAKRCRFPFLFPFLPVLLLTTVWGGEVAEGRRDRNR